MFARSIINHKILIVCHLLKHTFFFFSFLRKKKFENIKLMDTIDVPIQTVCLFVLDMHGIYISSLRVQKSLDTGFYHTEQCGNAYYKFVF